MIILLIFSFLAGIVTILSPCILPILPIILSSSVDHVSKRKPIGVVLGFIASFTFFTLFLSSIVRMIGIPADSLRLFSIIVLIIFGLSLVTPQFQTIIEKLFSRLLRFAPNNTNKTGFIGGFIIGLSLGLLWTPCVGPILASVISLALTGTVTTQAFFITLSYSLGTAIPMFIIMHTGSKTLQKIPWLLRNSAKIQKIFGVLMILTALGIFFNFDRKFQSFILDKFPSYGTGLTKLEDNRSVIDELENIEESDVNSNKKKLTTSLIPKRTIAPEIIQGGEWFNSKPLKLSSLRGKVVVIDFWTYSCINCQRTFPYLRSWYEKYKDDGLVIVGVHSPEFEFEKNPRNVEKAISDFGLLYPIMQDNNFATWQAYSNKYWPAKYFIDKDGYVRYAHFGEGEYDKSEKIIQELLSESGKDITQDISNESYQIYSKTPETYLGYLRIHNFSKDFIKDQEYSYAPISPVPDDKFTYEGKWTVTKEYSAPRKNSKLLLNFESKEVYLVARPKIKNSKFKVYVDGKLQYFGKDNKYGIVTLDSDKLYKIINLPEPGRHILEIEFLDDNCEVFAFTFG